MASINTCPCLKRRTCINFVSRSLFRNPTKWISSTCHFSHKKLIIDCWENKNHTSRSQSIMNAVKVRSKKSHTPWLHFSAPQESTIGLNIVLPPWGCGPLLYKHIQGLEGNWILKKNAFTHMATPGCFKFKTFQVREGSGTKRLFLPKKKRRLYEPIT